MWGVEVKNADEGRCAMRERSLMYREVYWVEGMDLPRTPP